MCLPPELSDNMGCTGSVVYPAGDTIEKRKPANGVTISTKNDNPNYLKGDYSQLQYAKHNRDKYLRQRQSKTFIAANEMSGRIMEERELLSLGTRSRGTSRNTSRTASPTSARKSLNIKDDLPGAMTPVAEDLHSQNSRRPIDNEDENGDVLRLQKNSKTKSNNKPSIHKNKTIKKQKSPRVSKKKGKPKKPRTLKKGKGVKLGKEPLIGADDIDSGLEDNVEYDSDTHRSDDGEEGNGNVASGTHKFDAEGSDGNGETEQSLLKDSGVEGDDCAKKVDISNVVGETVTRSNVSVDNDDGSTVSKTKNNCIANGVNEVPSTECDENNDITRIQSKQEHMTCVDNEMEHKSSDINRHDTCGDQTFPSEAVSEVEESIEQSNDVTGTIVLNDEMVENKI